MSIFATAVRTRVLHIRIELLDAMLSSISHLLFSFCISTQLISICVTTFTSTFCALCHPTRMYFISPLWVYFLVFLFSVKWSSAKEFKTLEERTLARRNIESNLLLYSRFATGRILFCSLLNDRILFITNVDFPEVFEVNISALTGRDLSLKGVKPQPLKTKFPALYNSPQFSQMISTRNWSSIQTRSVGMNLKNEEILFLVHNYTLETEIEVHFGAIAFSFTFNQTSFRDIEVSLYRLNFTDSHFISSTEPNVFYNFYTVKDILGEYDWFGKYEYDFKFKTFVEILALRVCKHSHGNENGSETIAFLERHNTTDQCERLDWGDLWHYDGFTDMKHFYLFGRRNLVYIFEHPDKFNNWSIVYTAKRITVSMKDFFNVNRTQLAPDPNPTTTTISNTQTPPPKTTPCRFLTDFRVEMISLVVICIGLTINFAIVLICHRNRFRIGRYLGKLFGIDHVDHPAGGL